MILDQSRNPMKSIKKIIKNVKIRDIFQEYVVAGHSLVSSVVH